MNAFKNYLETNSNFEVLTISHLVDLYDGVIDELRCCANVNPITEVDHVTADLLEAKLLNFEEDLLKKAAKMKINSKNDLLKLMDIWAKSADINTGSEISPSDRIAMNIFRHLSNAEITIG